MLSKQSSVYIFVTLCVLALYQNCGSQSDVPTPKNSSPQSIEVQGSVILNLDGCGTAVCTANPYRCYRLNTEETSLSEGQIVSVAGFLEPYVVQPDMISLCELDTIHASDIEPL